MTVPDRHTREQLDAIPHKAAALLLAAARPDPTLRTAARQVQDALIAQDAEVRALRDELGLEMGMRTAAVDELETLRRALWELFGSEPLVDEEVLRRVGVAARPRPPGLVEIVDVGPGRGCARVEGRCPTCGVRSLFLGAGARVTCASLSCTDPCAVDDYLDGDGRAALAARPPRPAAFDGWADLPTPDDVAAEMSRQAVGSDTPARRDSLVGAACQALDAIGTLRERGVRRSAPAPRPAAPEGGQPADLAEALRLLRPVGSLDTVTGRAWQMVADALAPAVPDGEAEPDWHNKRERLHSELGAIVGVTPREKRTGDADGDLIEMVRRAVASRSDGKDAAEGLLSVQELTKVLTQACEWEDSGISDPTGVATYLASWLDAADLQVRRAPTVINLPSGEDVPARLDAAADALESLHSHGLGYDLRQVADQLRDGDGGTPVLRAAVAAALARPTGGEG